MCDPFEVAYDELIGNALKIEWRLATLRKLSEVLQDRPVSSLPGPMSVSDD